jgi:chromosome segregation ATPase
MTNMLLMTPLMKEVAKAPVISPPITRTNVLRMDNNFKYAVELYDYLAAYEGDGYTIEHKDVQQKPFEDALEGEIDELVAITSYLTYKYGSESGKLLEERYLAEELARQEKAEQQRREKLEQLKLRAHESQASMEEYLLALEEQNKMLTRHADQLRIATETLQKSVDREAQKLSAVYYAQCEQRFAEKREELIATCEQRIAEKDAALAVATEQNEAAATEIDGLRARVHALQHRVGEVPVEDTTTREYIAQLEREYAWFEDMFEKNWKLTKKRIRKDILWSKKK